MATTTTPFSSIRATVEEHFGHDRLRPGQEDAIAALLDGQDVLLVSPTGSGKSLTYQVAGLLSGGLTIVVSPLLALQQDQVDALTEVGIGAARLSSAESAGAREEAMEGMRSGAIRFALLGPEQLARPQVRGALAALRPTLVAVDEAHCVSTWGHDFRPDYLRLGDLVQELGTPRVVAMTATAALPTRRDIVERLHLRAPCLVVTGFERDNIALHVHRCLDERDQQERVLGEVDGRRADAGSVLVYCRTRKGAEAYAAELATRGHRVAAYHAGLGKRRREEVQRSFMTDDLDVVVATSAFGMGIDKPGIGLVVHADVPESPDTYHQEVGRAGRDGAPAAGVLFYRSEDLALGRFFATPVPGRGDVVDVASTMARTGSRDPREVRERLDLGPRKTARLVNLVSLALEASGCSDLPPEQLADLVIERAEAQRRLERSRVEMMRAYAETDRCRSAFLLAYFGAPVSGRCGVCDNCVDGVAADERADASARFAVQAAVRHDEFGVGVVTDVVQDRLTVLFDDAGYRTLSLEAVEDNDLLEPA
ncbi:RecQ family ATP-dependent DNA helicase [Knoellia sp. CPCC 206450]|uniref:RecQ family ATP-dependent DNA helicase n=1 Tax=Knoellia tibetensis TaxID=3404798 RepID=UPI003B432452